jgi:hypothetical protein
VTLAVVCLTNAVDGVATFAAKILRAGVKDVSYCQIIKVYQYTWLSFIRLLGLDSLASAYFLFPLPPSNLTGTLISIFTARIVNSFPIAAREELTLLVIRGFGGEIVLLLTER